MHVDFSVADRPAPAASLTLRTVYSLNADSSYDVRTSGRKTRGLVALRTIGGLGKVTLEGLPEIDVEPGSLLFFRHTRVRRYYCAAREWNFWWFEFLGEMPDLPLNRPIMLDRVREEEALCRDCLALLKKANAGHGRLASATLGLLLSRWMLGMEAARSGDPRRTVVEDAISHMKMNLDQPPAVAELAGRAGLCERRFRQVFAGITGMQPKKYLDALRMAAAEELLLGTSFTIQEIALRLGYSSQFHFSRAFRAAHSAPPSRFRASAGE